MWSPFGLAILLELNNNLYLNIFRLELPDKDLQQNEKYPHSILEFHLLMNITKHNIQWIVLYKLNALAEQTFFNVIWSLITLTIDWRLSESCSSFQRSPQIVSNSFGNFYHCFNEWLWCKYNPTWHCFRFNVNSRIAWNRAHTNEKNYLAETLINIYYRCRDCSVR